MRGGNEGATHCRHDDSYLTSKATLSTISQLHETRAFAIILLFHIRLQHWQKPSVENFSLHSLYHLQRSNEDC